MDFIVYCSVALMVLLLGACSREAPLSRYKGQEVLVAKIITVTKTKAQIAECTAWSDRAHNDERVEIPTDKFRKSVFSQIVWWEAMKYESGRLNLVTPEQFGLYESFKNRVIKRANVETILENNSKCINYIEVASGGIGKIFRASK